MSEGSSKVASQRAVSGAALHPAGPPAWSSARFHAHPAPSDSVNGSCKRSSSTASRDGGGAARGPPAQPSTEGPLTSVRSATTSEPSEAIRIAVRVRPFNEQDRRMGFGRSCAISMVGQNTKVRTDDGPLHFQSDMTFWSHDPQSASHATQEDVFSELGVPLLRGGLSGYNGCLLAFGQTGAGKSHTIIGSPAQPGILPRLVEGLLQERSWAVGDGTTGSSAAGFELRVWFSAVEILGERVRDLLSAIVDTEGVEEPAVVQHPTLGIQAVGVVEAPCLEAIDARQLLDYAAKKRAHSAGNVGGAFSSRSHALFFVRLDVRHGGRCMHSRVTLADLAGSERSGQASTAAARPFAFAREGRAINHSLAMLAWTVRELNESSSGTKSASSSVCFQASKLTLALKDALVGNSRTWLLAAVAPGTESAEESAATLRFAESVRRLRTSPRPFHGAWAEALNSLQEDAFRVRVQLISGDSEQPVRELPVADRQRLAEEMQRPRQLQVDEGLRLRREREKALESLGLLNVDAEEAFSLEQVTPYLLNMSDDPQLAGCLLYFLRRGEETCIGSEASSTIVVTGLGVLPRLCTVVNHDNVRVSLQRPDDSRRHVLLNGQVLQSPQELQLCHHDRLYLGHALVLRLHVPMQAEVETIDESEEHTGTLPPPPNHELVLCSHPRECLPVLPDRSQSFSDLQLYMQHSESFSELQLYMEDLYDKLEADRGHAFFRTLQEACHLIDEANAITRKLRPDDRLHFEVEFVWDIYRDVEDILMIRVMHCSEMQGRGDVVLHYWTYTKFRERLDMMRDVFFTQHLSGSWSGKGDIHEDPWIEPGTADLQQRLLITVLSERRRAAAATADAGKQQVNTVTRSSSARSVAPNDHSTQRRTTGSATPPSSPATDSRISQIWAAEAVGVAAGGATASRIRNGHRVFPSKERPSGSPPQGNRNSKQLQRTAKPHHSLPLNVAAGPDACAGDGLSAGEQSSWCRANNVSSMPTAVTAAPKGATNPTVENERLKEMVISLQQQLEAVQKKTDSFDQMQEQMTFMQSMLQGQGVTSILGSLRSDCGASSATPGSATLPDSVDGTDRNEQAYADSTALPSPQPLSSEAPAASEPLSVEVPLGTPQGTFSWPPAGSPGQRDGHTLEMEISSGGSCQPPGADPNRTFSGGSCQLPGAIQSTASFGEASRSASFEVMPTSQAPIVTTVVMPTAKPLVAAPTGSSSAPVPLGSSSAPVPNPPHAELRRPVVITRTPMSPPRPMMTSMLHAPASLMTATSRATPSSGVRTPTAADIVLGAGTPTDSPHPGFRTLITDGSAASLDAGLARGGPQILRRSDSRGLSPAASPASQTRTVLGDAVGSLTSSHIGHRLSAGSLTPVPPSRVSEGSVLASPAGSPAASHRQLLPQSGSQPVLINSSTWRGGLLDSPSYRQASAGLRQQAMPSASTMPSPIVYQQAIAGAGLPPYRMPATPRVMSAGRLQPRGISPQR